MKRALVALLILGALPLAAQATFTAANTSLTTFVDVSVPVITDTQQNVSGLCSTGPFTSSAPVFKVHFSIHPKLTGYQTGRAPFLLVEKDRKNFAFINYHLTGEATLPAFTTARKTYPSVSFADATGEISITDLTWGDAADVVDTIVNRRELVTSFFAQLLPRLTMTVVPVTTSVDSSAGDILAMLSEADSPVPLGRFKTAAQWQATVAFVQSANAQAPRTLTLDGTQVVLTSGTPSSLPVSTLNVAPLSAAQTERLREDLRYAINPNIDTTSTQSVTDTAAIGASGPLLIVDSPCYAVRLLPASTGDAFSLLEFNARLLAPWNSGHNFARAEGRVTRPLQDAQGSTVNLSGEVAHLWDLLPKAPSLHPRFALSAVATYDETEGASVNSTREAFGVKAALSFRNAGRIASLETLSGDETRPTLTFEGHYGNDEQTGQARVRSFDLRSTLKAKFRWSQLSYSRIEAAAAYSEEKKFSGRSRFAYVNLDLIRFVIRNPIEFAASYSCGRQPPLYEDKCGFLTGFSMVSNQ